MRSELSMSATQTELLNYLKLLEWWSHAAESSTLGVFVMLVVLVLRSVLSVSLSCRNKTNLIFPKIFVLFTHLLCTFRREQNQKQLRFAKSAKECRIFQHELKTYSPKARSSIHFNFIALYSVFLQALWKQK